jgi:pyruvate dehydrogenase E1 component alpha subunit
MPRNRHSSVPENDSFPVTKTRSRGRMMLVGDIAVEDAQAAEECDVGGRIDDDDLQTLLTIRRFEEALLRLFGEGLLDGTTHTCLGQEYVPVAVTALLDRRDVVFSNHRGHGHYLARYPDPVPLLAEIMGREGGLCAGVGGSQHLHRDTYFSTGVQGESLPLATGVAVHLKRAEPGAMALVYVGDGTMGEGAVYEALNMAALWKLPLCVVVENNHVAQTTPTTAHLAGSIRGRAEAFGIAHHAVAGCDVPAIRAALAPPLAAVRAGAPLVVEFDTVRLGPHSKGDDTRDQAQLAAVRRRDWAARYAAAFPEQFDAVDARVRAAVERAVAEVTARPPATWPVPR